MKFEGLNESKLTPEAPDCEAVLPPGCSRLEVTGFALCSNPSQPFGQLQPPVVRSSRSWRFHALLPSSLLIMPSFSLPFPPLPSPPFLLLSLSVSLPRLL